MCFVAVGEDELPAEYKLFLPLQCVSCAALGGVCVLVCVSVLLFRGENELFLPLHRVVCCTEWGLGAVLCVFSFAGRSSCQSVAGVMFARAT